MDNMGILPLSGRGRLSDACVLHGLIDDGNSDGPCYLLCCLSFLLLATNSRTVRNNIHF